MFYAVVAIILFNYVPRCLRTERLTLDQIHIIRQIVEKSYEYNQKNLFTLFIDYKQEYDYCTRTSIDDYGRTRSTS